MDNAAEALWSLTDFQAAEVPPNDAERVAALHALGILDTPQTECFDQVTRLTAKALGVPIVLVSLVDECRQWFKSRIGVDVTQTSRAVSFCAHVMVSLRPLIVRDATLDARFAANPLVMDAPFVRAYAGFPLFTADGHAIGTLCAIDHKPRDFDDDELQMLRDSASLIQGFIYAGELAARNEAVLMDSRERELLFRDSFERAGVGIIHCGTSGELLRVNQRLCEMLGYSAQELRDSSYLDISHPDELGTTSDLLQSVSAGTIDSYSIEKRYLRKDGTFLWAFLSVSLCRTQSGKPDYFIAVIEDISARKQLEIELVRSREALAGDLAEQTQKLQDSNVALRTQVKKLLAAERKVQQTEQRLWAIANCMPVLLGYWNRQLTCEFANEAYRGGFGIAPERIIGMTMSDLVGPVAYAEIEAYVQRALAGSPQLFERSVSNANNTQTHVEVRFLPDLDETGAVSGFVAITTDVTTARNVQFALEAANAALSNNDLSDYLTGISNRRHLNLVGEEAAARFVDSGETFGIILLDVDHLRQLNEARGHGAGDEVLRNVGSLLKRQMRNHRDVAARLGGGEFAVLCFGDLDEELLWIIAEEIRRGVSSEASSGNLRVTVSLGVAISRGGDLEFKQVYSRADAALDSAQAAGRNRVEIGRVV